MDPLEQLVAARLVPVVVLDDSLQADPLPCQVRALDLGVGPKNLHEYLDIPAVSAVGGSWMVPRDLVNAGDFVKIVRLTEEAVALANR